MLKKLKVCFNQQVFLGHNGVRDIEGNELPRLIYVSREKRPGFEHHKKAGAMNSLVSFLCVCVCVCVSVDQERNN